MLYCIQPNQQLLSQPNIKLLSQLVHAVVFLRRQTSRGFSLEELAQLIKKPESEAPNTTVMAILLLCCCASCGKNCSHRSLVFVRHSEGEYPFSY